MRRTQYGFSPTVILVVINIVVYIYTSYRGGNFVITAENVLRVYGQFNYAVLNLGLWWQLITSMFVHVSIAHLAGNMFFLFIFGLRAEDLFVDSEY
ncbi:MAG: rhomboid family intramembrane serine protease, partial [Candidatus Hodarchaeota archaeon]